MIGLDSYSKQVFIYLDPILIYINRSLNRLPIWNSQNCSMFPLAFVAGWLQGHWWGFISRNYVVWPTFLLMNVFIALKGSYFWSLMTIKEWLPLNSIFYFGIYSMFMELMSFFLFRNTLCLHDCRYCNPHITVWRMWLFNFYKLLGPLWCSSARLLLSSGVSNQSLNLESVNIYKNKNQSK